MNDVQVLDRILRQRRSIRRYRPEPVPDKVLRSLIEAATLAPSAGNRQDWEFTVVTRPDTIAAMARAVSKCWSRMLTDPAVSSAAEGLRDYAKYFSWFCEAPVVIAVSSKAPEAFLVALCQHNAGAVHGSATSAAMAAQNLMLAAHAMELGSCCLTGPIAASTEFKEILGLGNRRELVCLITLGFPAAQCESPGRKPLEEVLRYVD